MQVEAVSIKQPIVVFGVERLDGLIRSTSLVQKVQKWKEQM